MGLVLFGVLGGIIVAVLVVPFKALFKIEGNGRPVWSVEITWFAGLFRLFRQAEGLFFAIGPWKKKFFLNRTDADTAATIVPAARQYQSFFRKMRGTRDSEKKDNFSRMLQAIFAAASLIVRGHVRYGIEDPALASWIYGAFCVLKSTRIFSRLRVTPEYEEVGWWGSVEIVASIRLIGICGPSARYVTRRAMSKVWKTFKGENAA